jgi:DNA-binding CsgD family transcriptional regulator/tetratricopeptide (TPR) repeat protein
VLERLSLLPEDATRVLEAVAVAEEPVDLELIAAATKLNSARIADAVRLLAAADLLISDSVLLRMTPILRRTVYDEIDVKERSKVHLAVATHLKLRGASFEVVAEHLVATDPGRKVWVARELFEAASTATTKGGDSQALRYLRRAFAEQSTAWDDPALLLDLVRVETHSDPRAAVEHLLRAVERGAEPGQAAGVARELVLRLPEYDTTTVSCSDTATELGSVLERISAALPDADVSDRIELRITGALAAGQQFASAAIEALKHEFDISEPRTQAEYKATALFAIADSVSPKRARPSEIAGSLRRVLLDAQLCNEDPIECQLWARTLLSLARAGEFAPADQFARHAQAMSSTRGLLAAQAEYSLSLAMSLMMQGRIYEANAHVLHSLSVAHGRGWGRRPDAVACLVASLVDLGRWDEAEAVLSHYSGLEREIPSFEGPSFLEQRGRLRGCQGRTTEALSDLLEAGGRADECGVDSPVVTTWRGEAAQLLAKEGRTEEAAPLARANLELARTHGVDWVVGSALRVWALTVAEEKRLGKLKEAVQLLENSPARLQLAIALTDLGQALRQAGQPLPVARLALRRGLDIAFCLKAAPLVSRAMTELRLSGARPRRVAVSGPESLTSGERRVVALAADGLTNSEIASALFITEKTVEGHLVRVYRKLGVRSRRDLKNLVDRSGSSEQKFNAMTGALGAGLGVALPPALRPPTSQAREFPGDEHVDATEQEKASPGQHRRRSSAAGRGV